jgi:hypothetical protein
MDSCGRWSDTEGLKEKPLVNCCSYDSHKRSKQRGGLESEGV